MRSRFRYLDCPPDFGDAPEFWLVTDGGDAVLLFDGGLASSRFEDPWVVDGIWPVVPN